MSSTRTYTPFPYTTLFRSKGAALNPGASGPKPMKKTDGMRLRPTSRTYRHFRTAFVLSTRMAPATLAGNRHRSIGTDRRRDKLMSERSEEHTSELQSLMRISYSVFCMKKKKKSKRNN